MNGIDAVITLQLSSLLFAQGIISKHHQDDNVPFVDADDYLKDLGRIFLIDAFKHNKSLTIIENIEILLTTPKTYFLNSSIKIPSTKKSFQLAIKNATFEECTTLFKALSKYKDFWDKAPSCIHGEATFISLARYFQKKPKEGACDSKNLAVHLYDNVYKLLKTEIIPPSIRLLYADQLSDKTNYPDAIKLYESVLENNNKLDHLFQTTSEYQKFGNCLMLDKQYNKARETFKRALNLEKFSNELEDNSLQKWVIKLGLLYTDICEKKFEGSIFSKINAIFDDIKPDKHYNQCLDVLFKFYNFFFTTIDRPDECKGLLDIIQQKTIERIKAKQLDKNKRQSAIIQLKLEQRKNLPQVQINLKSASLKQPNNNSPKSKHNKNLNVPALRSSMVSLSPIQEVSQRGRQRSSSFKERRARNKESSTYSQNCFRAGKFIRPRKKRTLYLLYLKQNKLK